jgi:hypothetical protein
MAAQRVGVLACALILTFGSGSYAQKKEIKKDSSWVETNSKKGFKLLMGAITREPPSKSVIHVKSEAPYLPYEGKIIRKITIKRVGFETTVIDTTQQFQSFIARVANKLHTDTREFVIRDNLFVREGTPLNPYRVADNERILRNLNFVMDARILIRRISKNSDSVDLLVMTRDVFTLLGSFEPLSTTEYKFSIQEANAAGMGQRIQVAGLYDSDRNTRFGFETFYQKINIMGSFVDASVGYSSINTGISIGNENEAGYYFRLSRPLFHPFVRWAGAVEWSQYRSTNVFRRPDSVFVPYNYAIRDFWVGYSFGHANPHTVWKENRNRRFVAIRSFHQDFAGLPEMALREPDRFAYRSRLTVLAELTFFRQDFYKTQYVAGFGRTEDIPYGYRASFTGGWETEVGNKRAYLGTELYYTKVHDSGAILTYRVRLATYLQGAGTEDGMFALHFRRFSQVHLIGNKKFRHQIESGYSWIFNQQVKRGVDINDFNGIMGFRADSLVGSQRLTLAEEAVMYTPWKVLGFRLAPVMRIDMAMINQISPLLRKENFFAGISLGIKARNENLIFDTVEARMYFYPNTVEGMNQVGFSVTTSIRVKYPINLVSPPSTVFNPGSL